MSASISVKVTAVLDADGNVVCTVAHDAQQAVITFLPNSVQVTTPDPAAASER